jgi:endonuclease/exonuclease/phosphatase family metal-dependent hydrolase
MFIINRIVFALNGLAILVLLLSYAAPYVSPELYWPIAFLGLAYPVIVALHFVFIIYWIAVFKLKFLYSFVAILLGYSFIPSYVQIGAKKNTEKEKTLTIMNFNTKTFGAFEGKKVVDGDKFFDIVNKVAPNLICLQEYRNCSTPIERAMFKGIAKKFRAFYSYGTFNTEIGLPSGNEMVIFSRFPIIDSGIVERQEGSWNFSVFVDIITFGDTIRIINTHLQSIKFDAPDYAAMKNIKLPDDSTVSALTNISRKLKIAFVKRAKQAEAIRDFIDKSPYKVIVMGDFNDSPSSYSYRMMKGKLKDAFVESGSGLGRTYVGAMPSFRIDYILHDPSFTSYNYYAKAFEFSDHKMVSCTIKMK